MGISSSKVTCYRPDFTRGVPKKTELREWHFQFFCLECVFPKHDFFRPDCTASWKVQEWINRHHTNFEKGDYATETWESKHVGKYNTNTDPRKSNSHTSSRCSRSFPSTHMINGSDDEMYEERGRRPNLTPFMYRFPEEEDDDDDYCELEKIVRTREWVSNHKTIFETQDYAEKASRNKNIGATDDIAVLGLTNKLIPGKRKNKGKIPNEKKKPDGRGKVKTIAYPQTEL